MQRFIRTNEKCYKVLIQKLSQFLYLKSLTKLFRIILEKKNPLVAICGTIIYGNTLLKCQSLEKSMKNITVYTFIFTEFPFFEYARYVN